MTTSTTNGIPSYRNLSTGEIAPAHRIGTDAAGRPIYQRVDGWEPTVTCELDADGNWLASAGSIVEQPYSG